MLAPALAAEQAERALMGVELDAYTKMFANREREESEDSKPA